MKILAFDTSDQSTSVAISSGATILSYIEDLRPSMQAQLLLPMIEKSLKFATISYSDINYVGVTAGPGSFTGIRVGLATASALTIGNNKIKALTVSNFEIIYNRIVNHVPIYDKLFIFINAYRNQLYTQIFDKSGIGAEPILVDYDNAIKLVKKESGTIVCGGNGVIFLYPRINSLENVRILPRFTKVKAWHICNYILSNKENLPTSPLEPLYIRDANTSIFN